MKNMKRFFALFLAMAMVLGMSMMAFAAPGDESSAAKAKITVKNIAIPETEENGTEGIGSAKVEYVQIIEATAIDNTYTKGWKFTDDKYADAYKTAYKADSYNNAIEQLIAEATTAQKENEANVVSVTNSAAARNAISSASAAVSAGGWTVVNNDVKTGSVEWTVSAPGLYIIRIEQAGYNYLAMAAYVGFGQVTLVNGTLTYPSLNDAVLYTKGAPLSLEKTNTDEDGVVAVGDVLTYTITTTVPYIDWANRPESYSYVIKDTITGATYVESNNKVAVTAQFVEGDTKTDAGVEAPEVKSNNDGSSSFEMDLSSLINEQNSNANRVIAITYQAKVTAIDNITNEAAAGQGSGTDFNVKYGKDKDEVFTGELTITKQDASNAETKLAGAEFEVTKGTDTTALKFTAVMKKVTVTENGVDVEKEVVDYYKYDKEGTLTTVTTGVDGVATIKGLDIGIYSFKEVVAPTGYTINEASVTGEVKLADGVSESEKVTSAGQITFEGATMSDTTISALPSTGGIGTTIFTVGGCAIMILAAGMFFVSRRRASR